MKRSILSLNIFLCLFFFKCPADGPANGFDISNQTSNQIVVIGKRVPPNDYVKEVQIAPEQKGNFSYLFSNKKRKPSYFYEYLKVTKEDDTVLLDLRGNDLDTSFEVESETDSEIIYRMDVN